MESTAQRPRPSGARPLPNLLVEKHALAHHRPVVVTFAAARAFAKPKSESRATPPAGETLRPRRSRHHTLRGVNFGAHYHRTSGLDPRVLTHSTIMRSALVRLRTQESGSRSFIFAFIAEPTYSRLSVLRGVRGAERALRVRVSPLRSPVPSPLTVHSSHIRVNWVPCSTYITPARARTCHGACSRAPCWTWSGLAT